MMNEIRGYFAQLTGTSEQVGRLQGRTIKEHEALLDFMVLPETLPAERLRETIKMLDEYCPGINEEVHGLAEEIGVSPGRIRYYAETDLIPGCSHFAIAPRKMMDGKMYMMRNYDMSVDMDDMRLCSTNIEGSYSHTGFSVAMLGRTEGMNEHGLCVTFSACGLPVGDAPGLRPAKVRGLQFWAVVRTVLERCRNTAEAVAAIQDMPIASNMNVIVGDASGEAALISLVDGQLGIRHAELEAGDGYITATNHPLFEEMKQLGIHRMNHSVVRHDLMEKRLRNEQQFNKEDLLRLVQAEYPHGLTVHNYAQSFGTLRSILFNLTDQTMDVCFGSPLTNPWYCVRVGETLPFTTIPVKVEQGLYDGSFWQSV